MILKRLINELKKMDNAELCENTCNGTYFIKLDYCNIHIPNNYPFNPPKTNIEFIKTSIDPTIWCFTILSNPILKKRMETWRISCSCCHSITCQHNWRYSYLLKDVAEEALFNKTYNDICIKKIKFPKLPIDILEYIVINHC